MKEERISLYRVLSIVGMFISSIALAGMLCYINKLEVDQIICVLFLVIAFMPIIIIELAFERRRLMLGQNTQTTYQRVMHGFFVCSLVMLGISFMPEYFKLVILIPLIMSAFSNSILGLIVGVFFNVLLAFTCGGNFLELLAYTILVLVGGTLSKMLKYVEYRLYIGLIFLFCSVLFPNIFLYFTNKSIVFNDLIFGLFNGFLVAIYVIVLYPKTREKTNREKHYYYGDLLEDDYSPVSVVREHMPAYYMHARKVSEIAYKYAVQLELDADLAATAGFYYHIGKWEGGFPIQNAVKKAKELCFPEELIQILREYNATDDLPSTPESALVHMIDGVLCKIEKAKEKNTTSEFDREALINETLIDFSSNGIYDKSGLSINAFLKIKSWLLKEEFLE